MANLFKKRRFAAFAALAVVVLLVSGFLSGLVAPVFAQGKVTPKDVARLRADIQKASGKGTANTDRLEKLTKQVDDLTKKVDNLDNVNNKILSIVQTALSVVGVFVFVNFLGSSYLYRRDKEQAQKDTVTLLAQAIREFSDKSSAKIAELVDTKFSAVEKEVELIKINFLLAEREQHFASGVYQNALTKDMDIIRAALKKEIQGVILDNALSRLEADLFQIVDQKNERGIFDTDASRISELLQQLPPRFDTAISSIRPLIVKARAKRIVSELPK